MVCPFSPGNHEKLSLTKFGTSVTNIVWRRQKKIGKEGCRFFRPMLEPLRSPPKMFHCHSTYSYMTTNNRYSIHKGVLPTRNVYMSWHFWIRYFAIFDTRRRSKSLLITLGLIRETSWRMRSLSDYLVGLLGFTLIVTGKSTELMTLITNP